MYAFLSSKDAGGSSGTFSTTSTQRFPSVATSTTLTWLLSPSSSSPPPRVKTAGWLFETQTAIPLQLLMEDDNGGWKASSSGLMWWLKTPLISYGKEDLLIEGFGICRRRYIAREKERYTTLICCKNQRYGKERDDEVNNIPVFLFSLVPLVWRT